MIPKKKADFENIFSKNKVNDLSSSLGRKEVMMFLVLKTYSKPMIHRDIRGMKKKKIMSQIQ
jgi:hypothetical protein